ncbi:MAG: hypothetical protein C1943_03275 [Halochromatium sp.]|nr:hypothetical protein [Halochromatium sp.]
MYSFDVFDTLITRTFLRPTNLFVQVAVDIAPSCREIDAASFADARQRAEMRARRQAQPRDDCRFVEIYAHFTELGQLGVSRQAVMDAELAAEGALSRPIRRNAEHVRRLLDSGERVVFLSDMYLPGDFIWDLICRHVAPCDREQVLVSGEIGLSKHSGRLYRYLLERESIEPGQLIHVGDNAHSDIRVARQLGIQAHHYTEILPTRYELRLDGAGSGAPSGGAGLGGLARAARVGVAGGAGLARVACNVVAPFLTVFVAWLLADARRRSLDRLYFVARNGQILMKIAEAMRREGDPECRYLYGSRQAWLLPAVTEVTPSSLAWAWDRSMVRTGDDILRRLEIDNPAVREVLSRHGFEGEHLSRRLDEAALKLFITVLAKDPIASWIAERARARRSVLQGYLKQEGLLDEERWAIVDVGWALRCQHALKQVLADAGSEAEVEGYYLGVSDEHLPLEEAGLCHAFVRAPGSAVDGALSAAWFFKRSTILLIEHLFTIADHASVVDYRRVGDQIRPTLKLDSPASDLIAFARELHEAVLAFTRELAATSGADPCAAAYRDRAFAVVRDFCMRPEPVDVQDIAWLGANRDQSHAACHERPLASPLTWGDLISMVGAELSPRRGAAFAPRSTWLAGSAALSTPTVAWLFRSLTWSSDLFRGFRARP